MTRAFAFHPEAQAEFAADVEWYDDREFGLGGRFLEAVRIAVDAALDDPVAWPSWNGLPGVRSKRVMDFPYRVVYLVDGELLIVLAVAHVRRRPGYWRDRVSA